MELDKHYRVKHTILLQVVRDILIKNNLTTREEFKELYLDRVESSTLTEDDKEVLKETVK